ncbi:hypothetical protein TNCV_4333021 [Trichonephila clavipes]|nr:hypothetical protein TNCV_4333021 [Trichonephila clavipes]
MKRSTPPSSKFAKKVLKRNVENKGASYAFGTSLFSTKQKLPEALGPGWYETQILNVGRKVSYPQTFGGAPIIRHKNWLGGLEVVCPLLQSKSEGSIPGGVDRFFGCECPRSACHMIMWHVRDPLNINLALVLTATSSIQQTLN